MIRILESFTVMLWVAILCVAASIALVARAEEPDPTKTCESAGRTPIYGFPRMAPRLQHPENCYNELVNMLDHQLSACSSTTTTTLP